MSINYKNEKYNLLWKNIIIKKEVSSEYADKCIYLFMNDDKKMYLYKKLCSDEDALYDVIDNIVIGNTVNDNIVIGLNFIKEVLQINGL
jgi:hypothetical protein